MFRILVVDDDKNTRRLLQAVLENEGYQVFTAENGEDQDMINSASMSFKKSGIENLENVENAVSNMEILEKAANECEEEKEKIICVSNGLIDYISRFGNRIRKTVER